MLDGGPARDLEPRPAPSDGDTSWVRTLNACYRHDYGHAGSQFVESVRADDDRRPPPGLLVTRWPAKLSAPDVTGPWVHGHCSPRGRDHRAECSPSSGA